MPDESLSEDDRQTLSEIRIELEKQDTIVAQLRSAAKTARSLARSHAVEAARVAVKIQIELEQERAMVFRLQSITLATGDEDRSCHAVATSPTKTVGEVTCEIETERTDQV